VRSDEKEKKCGTRARYSCLVLSHRSAEAPAQDLSLIPRRQLFPSFEGVAHQIRVRISPNGRQLCYVASANGKHAIMTMPAAVSAPQEHPETSETSVIQSCEWAHTNRHIIYTRSQGVSPKAHVFCLDVDSGKTIDLTPFKTASASVLSLSRRFVHEALLLADEEGTGRADVLRVNIVTGKRTLALRNPGYSAFFADDDFQIRLAMSSTAGGGKAYFTPGENGQWKKVFDVLPAMAPISNIANPLGFDGQARHIYLRDNRDRNTSGLTACNLETGKTTSNRECRAAAVIRI